MEEQNIDLRKEDYTAFVGKHAETYLSKFKKFHVTGTDKFRLTWHWSVFFVPFLWMLYRKLYLWALLIFLLNAILLQPFIPLSVLHSDLRAHQGKIQLLLRFDQVVEARQAGKELLDKMPDDWWANLVNALIMAEEQSPQEAERFFIEWVERQPNFFRYLDLAYYYQLQNQPQKAASAMIRATDYDANTSWGHGGNSEFRGYTAAMYAFENGEYETAIKLCDTLLTVTINGDYAKQRLHTLREAAMRKIQGEGAEVLWADGIHPFNAFERIDIEKLLQRKVKRPVKAKYYKTQRSKHTPPPPPASPARRHQKTRTMAETQAITVSNANFTRIVLHSELPVMVDFWAPWCGPCRKAAPAVDEAARRFSGKLRIAKLNVDNNKKTASKYGVRAIPTFIFFQHGKEIGRISGFGNEQRFFNNIRQLLTQNTSS